MGYNNIEIANKLLRTAQGETYDGNSLYVAKDIPVVTDLDRNILDAWLTGINQRDPFEYRMRLQDIAIKIKNYNQTLNGTAEQRGR